VRQADENVVDKNLADISSNTRILNESKRLAFKFVTKEISQWLIAFGGAMMRLHRYAYG